MSKFIIQDWMGKHCYPDVSFTSFDDARDFISEVAHEQCIEAGLVDGTDEYEEALQGIEGDLYAVNIDENGKEIEDNGQYSY